MGFSSRWPLKVVVTVAAFGQSLQINANSHYSDPELLPHALCKVIADAVKRVWIKKVTSMTPFINTLISKAEIKTIWRSLL